jgi:hypothetical protein
MQIRQMRSKLALARAALLVLIDKTIQTSLTIDQPVLLV